MRFSSDFIDRVRDATDIIELIGQYVQLQKAGTSYKGLCPFPGHVEKTPSFFVTDAKQLYHCFGCGKGGTVFNFLADFQGMTFPEAIEYLAQRAHIALPPRQQSAEVQNHDDHSERKLALKLNKYVGSIFQKNLLDKKDDHPVKEYIRRRGLSEEILSVFKLGYAEAGWSDLTKALQRGRAPLNVAEKLGLIKIKSNQEYFDLFRDRIVFPIISSNDQVLGFGGRALGDQNPKYLNSPESFLFSKGKTLYGLHETAKHIRAANEAFLVEGYMDCVTLYQFGFKNVVATLGTAVTLDHVLSLKKLCSKVIVLLDGDAAGRNAADRSLALFLKGGLPSRCLILPDELDPDDFLRTRGVDEFRRRAAAAPDHFLLYLDRKLEGYRGLPTQKIEILNTVGPLLHHVRDQRLAGVYLHETADRLGVDENWVRQNAPREPIQAFENKEVLSKNAGAPQFPKEERLLVQFMLQNRAYLEVIQAAGVIELFESSELQSLALNIVEKYWQNPNDFDKLAASLAVQGTQVIKSLEILTSHFEPMNRLDESGEKQLIQDCLSRVKDRQLKRETKNILNSLRSDFDLNSEKLAHFMKIAQEQKGPKGP